MDSRHVLRTIPGIVGPWSLITAVLVLVQFLGPFDAVDYAMGRSVISSICNDGIASGTAIYQEWRSRVALDFVADMVGDDSLSESIDNESRNSRKEPYSVSSGRTDVSRCIVRRSRRPSFYESDR